jgi:FkbM family methyltransferase
MLSALPDKPWRNEEQWVTRRHTLPNGMIVACGNPEMADSLYHEIFTRKMYLRHCVRLAGDACVIDAGANIGLFSIFVSQAAPEARVYAFEPIPITCAHLRHNLCLHAARVRVFDHGLADADVVKRFTSYPCASALSGCYNDEQMVARWREMLVAQIVSSGASPSIAARRAADLLCGQDVECRVRPLSRVIAEQGIDAIELLKIDVERSEVDVLRGIGETDWPRIRQIVLEVHDEVMLDDTLAVLRERGYRATVDRVGKSVFLAYGVRPA